MEDREIKVNKVREHYEVHINGEFAFSADNMREVSETLEELEEQNLLTAS